MNNKSPAFQWYPKDYLGSVRVSMMTLAEEGAYRRALDYCWLNGSLPADSKMLAFVIGKNCTRKIAEVVKAMFVIHPEDESKLVHERLEKERKKQGDYQRTTTAAGKASAEKRWGRRDTTITDVTNDVTDALPQNDNVADNENVTLLFPSPPSSSPPGINILIKEEPAGLIPDFEKWATENFYNIEKLMVVTGAGNEFTIERLHLYHLSLVETSRYPITTKAAFAGFEKYLIHSLNAQRRKNNAPHQHSRDTKEQPLSGRLTKTAIERYLGRELTDDELAGFGYTEQSG